VSPSFVRCLHNQRFSALECSSNDCTLDIVLIVNPTYALGAVDRFGDSQLLKHRLSDNVVPVKYFLSVLTRALRRARHFALVEGSAIPTKAARNPFQVRNSVRPMHLFGPQPSIMITTSNSPAKGERIPNQLLDV
jgi:hypothetical protein